MARTTPGAPGDRVAAGPHVDRLAAGLHVDRLAAGLHVDRWNRIDPGLKDLAVLAVAANIGCTCGADAGYWDWATTREAMTRKIRAIHDWPDSEVFTQLERLVMLYAEAMTMTRPLVTGELLDELRRHLDDAQLGELTAIVTAENLRLRMGAALGAAEPGLTGRPGQPAASRD